MLLIHAGDCASPDAKRVWGFLRAKNGAKGVCQVQFSLSGLLRDKIV